MLKSLQKKIKINMLMVPHMEIITISTKIKLVMKVLMNRAKGSIIPIPEQILTRVVL